MYSILFLDEHRTPHLTFTPKIIFDFIPFVSVVLKFLFLVPAAFADAKTIEIVLIKLIRCAFLRDHIICLR